VVWEAIGLLQRGPNSSNPVKPIALSKDQGNEGGDLCSPAENKSAAVDSPRKTFSQAGTFDPAAIAKVRQREHQAWMDKVPTEFEVAQATGKLGSGKSGADAECPGEYWKALQGNEGLKDFVYELAVAMWKTGSY
jgi:hypothetical protein